MCVEGGAPASVMYVCVQGGGTTQGRMGRKGWGGTTQGRKGLKGCGIGDTPVTHMHMTALTCVTRHPGHTWVLPPPPASAPPPPPRSHLGPPPFTCPRPPPPRPCRSARCVWSLRRTRSPGRTCTGTSRPAGTGHSHGRSGCGTAHTMSLCRIDVRAHTMSLCRILMATAWAL